MTKPGGFSIDAVKVTAQTRTLKATYTQELADDLNASHGLGAKIPEQLTKWMELDSFERVWITDVLGFTEDWHGFEGTEQERTGYIARKSLFDTMSEEILKEVNREVIRQIYGQSQTTQKAASTTKSVGQAQQSSDDQDPN